MAINDISLTEGMRNTLFGLQQTAKLFDRTQTRLGTGKKVNSALDDPINYFAAKGHMDRATDLSGLKDSMNEAIQTIKAADVGIRGIENLISQAKSLANSALATNSTTDRATYEAQYDELLAQIDTIAADASYKGTNLINSNDLTVQFNPDGSSSLSVTGVDGTSSGLGVSAGDFSSDGAITVAVGELDTAVRTLRSNSQTLASNLSVIQTRLDFTAEMVNTLTKGAENLTLADMNEEGANLLMLQTRQALSSTSLSLASQAAQSVLRLF